MQIFFIFISILSICFSGNNIKSFEPKKIDSSISNSGDHEMLEDLIIAAHNDARNKVDSLVREEMSKVAGGLSLPSGLGIPGLS